MTAEFQQAQKTAQETKARREAAFKQLEATREHIGTAQKQLEDLNAKIGDADPFALASFKELVDSRVHVAAQLEALQQRERRDAAALEQAQAEDSKAAAKAEDLRLEMYQASLDAESDTLVKKCQDFEAKLRPLIAAHIARVQAEPSMRSLWLGRNNSERMMRVLEDIDRAERALEAEKAKEADFWNQKLIQARRDNAEVRACGGLMTFAEGMTEEEKAEATAWNAKQRANPTDPAEVERKRFKRQLAREGAHTAPGGVDRAQPIGPVTEYNEFRG